MNPTAPLLDINALSKKAGVSSRTIRYYGEKGLLQANERGVGGRRMYGPDALKRLTFISRLKSLGLTLKEIGALNQSFDRGKTQAMLNDLKILLKKRRRDVAIRINELKDLDKELATYQQRIQAKQKP